MNWVFRGTELTTQSQISRRRLLAMGALALIYPLLRFIHYRVPRKPRKIEISSTAPAGGVLIHGEFILFDRDDAAWAVSRKCTHLGCKINFHEQGNFLECPCHQSRFSPAGKAVRGPATVDLTVYPVEKRDVAPYYIITI